MPMDFLRRIEEASLPLAIHHEADIERAAVLVAAKLIEANLPEPGEIAGRPGVILHITALGRAELNRLREGQ